MRRTAFFSVFLTICFSVSPSLSQKLNFTTHWVGNTFGGKDQKWVQNYIDEIEIAGDTVYTESYWDEAGRVCGWYYDGTVDPGLMKWESTPEECWGWNTGGYALAVDKRYVYIGNCAGSLLRFDRKNKHRFVDRIKMFDTGAVGMHARFDTLYALFEDGHIQKRPTAKLKEMTIIATVPNARDITVDDRNTLWILAGDEIRNYSTRGEYLGRSIVEKGWQPYSIAVDHQGLLMVTDNSVFQVKFYDIAGEPKLVKTFGIEGGIGAGTPGAYGPQKFWRLTGAVTDADGNIYVAMDDEGTGIRKFNPNGELVWELYGLHFVDVVDVDPASDGRDLYGVNEHMTFDFDKKPGESWALAGITLDRLRSPDDPRISSDGTEWLAGNFMRRIDGHLLMYATRQTAGTLYVYRFDHDVALLSSTFSGLGWAFEPDDWGNIWYYDSSARFIKRIPLLGFDDNGEPVFGAAVSVAPIPAPFDDIERIEYDVDSDVMFIGGDTPQNPETSWGLMGSVLARYPNWSEGNRIADRQKVMPLDDDHLAPASMDMYEDYVFTVMVKSTGGVPSMVTVFRVDDLSKVGNMWPGPEVGGISGWTDIAYGIRAYKRSNGQYMVMVEEDYRGKVLVYLWDPPAGNLQKPQITLLEPEAGASFDAAPPSLTIRADASDADGSVVTVKFYIDDRFVGQDQNGTDGWSFTCREPLVVGMHTITARAFDNSGKARAAKPIKIFVRGTAGPFYGKPTVLPGTIQAEDFDHGGEGVGYHDADEINQGGAYRFEGVDIFLCSDSGNGYHVDQFEAGEWLQYTADVMTTGYYDLLFRVNSQSDQGSFSLYQNGRALVENLVVPNTGGLWQDVVIDSVRLEAGVQTWRFVCTQGGFKFNYFRVTAVGTGSIFREYWLNVQGTSVAQIPLHLPPDGRERLDRFEGPADWRDNYASRIRGYLHPPADGVYTFYIASDDNSQLYLSADENPINKKLIASVNDWTNPREWKKYGSQRSAGIELKAGRKYYIEALHKEGGGGDNLAVGWQTAGKPIEVIDALYLSPFRSPFCDLVIGEIIWRPTKPTPSEPTHFTVIVRNLGDVAKPAGTPFVVHFIVDGRLAAVGRGPIEEILPYSEVRVEAETGIMLADGPHVITVVVDAEDAVKENDEGNNRRSITLFSGLRPPDQPSSIVPGIYYEYYLGSWEKLPDFDSLTPRKTGILEKFDLPKNHAGDNFGVRYIGYIDIKQEGEYTFYTQSDDGSRLLIGGFEVVNNDGLHGFEEKSGVIPLQTGLHRIVVEFFEAGGDEALTVSYKGPNVSKRVIPKTVLFTDASLAAVKEIDSLPLVFALHPNYPNPFNPSTVIAYDLPKATNVKLTVFDLLGRTIITLVDKPQPAGRYRVEWPGVDAQGTPVAAGIYFCRLEAGDFCATIKMVLVK
ncbi:MAG: PA14 domain-containing protein [candidate division KSB1 bacterium]|nr:PA14 domain-containing protein [candidate division KSB1 bacterium]